MSPNTMSARSGMLEDRCARMWVKTTTAVYPSAACVEADNVHDCMDLIEGQVRYRKGKRWKSRWAVLRRVNPAADVLNLVLYQTQANARARQKERGFISLEKYCGLQLLNKIDSKHFNVIIIITTAEVIPLSFESIDQRASWLGHFQRHFGQEESFEGIVPHKQRLKAGETTLRFYKEKGFFSLTKKDSYRCTGKWNLKELPKYGAVQGGFAFQAASGTNSGEPSLYYFATRNGTEIRELFDGVCRAGEERHEEETCEAVANTEPEENKGQPNIFKRAWHRMSKRRKRSQDGRARTRSDPAPKRRHFKERGGESDKREAHAQVVARSLSSTQLEVGDNASPLPGYENFPVKSPGYENLPGEGDELEKVPLTTPEGYEVMTGEEKTTGPDGYEVMSPIEGSNSMKRFRFPAKRTSQECKKSAGKSEREEETETSGENDGDNLAKITSHSVKTEGTVKDSTNVARVNSKEPRTETDEKLGANANPTEETEPDEERQEPDENVNASVVSNEVSKSCSKDQEKNEELVCTGSGENREEASPPAEKAYSNGHVPTIITEEYNVTDVSPSVARRRGFKNPPPELKMPNVRDDESHPYVNSPPKTSDYVNLQGNQSTRNALNPAARLRGQTGTMPPRGGGGKSKLNPFAMYDSTDDSIYHSVESLMPSSHPGYQNVTFDPSRSHSFENISGHSYANVDGSPSYQNVTGTTVNRSYVNLPSRKQPANLNYVQVAGTDSVGLGVSPLVFDPNTAPTKQVKPSSDYTWIDEKKTSLLKETAKMHSDARKENVRRSVPKK